MVAPTVGLKGQLFLLGAIKIMGLWAGDLSSPRGQSCPHTKKGLTIHTQAPRFRRKVDEYWASHISRRKLHPGEKEKRQWGLKRRENRGSRGQRRGRGSMAANAASRFASSFGFMAVLPIHLKLQHGLWERIKQAALSYSFFMLLHWGSKGKKEWEATKLRGWGNEIKNRVT